MATVLFLRRLTKQLNRRRYDVKNMKKFVTGIAVIVVLLVVWFLYKSDFGSIRKHEYLLSFLINQGTERRDSFEHIFKQYIKNSLLLNINAKREGKASEMTYHITFYDDTQAQAFMRVLSEVHGVEDVHLITSKEDVEY